MLTKQLPARNENIAADDTPRAAPEWPRPVTTRVRNDRGDTAKARATATAPSFDETLRAIVRDIVREELARARPAATSDPTAHLSTRAAAQHAGVAIGTIRRWIRDGKLRELRAGRHLRVRRADLDVLLAGERNGPEVSPEELARQAFGA